LFVFYSHIPHSLDGRQFNDGSVVNFGRKPLAPITNNMNINNMNINDRIHDNTFDCSNEASGSYSRSRLNNTHRSNNTRNNMSFNGDDDDFFRLNAPNMFRPNNIRSFQSNNNEPTLPAPFHGMDNVNQICSWLCKNPNILLLAYNIYLSMQTPVANGFNFISNFNSTMLATTVPHVQKQEDAVNSTILYLYNGFVFVVILITNC
jgi:hypothetical protein